MPECFLIINYCRGGTVCVQVPFVITLAAGLQEGPTGTEWAAKILDAQNSSADVVGLEGLFLDTVWAKFMWLRAHPCFVKFR